MIAGHVHDPQQRTMPGQPGKKFPVWDCSCGLEMTSGEVEALARKANVGIPVPESDILAAVVGKMVTIYVAGNRDQEPDKCELLAVDKHGIAVRAVLYPKVIRFYRFEQLSFVEWPG